MSLEAVAAAAGTTVPALRRRYRTKADLAAGLPESADLDALTSMLIGSFYGQYVTPAGIPDDWPDRVLSAIWPPEQRPEGR